MMMNNDTLLPVKIMLAHDGSSHTNAAVNLLAHIDWPPKSTTHVLTVIPSPKDAPTGDIDDYSEPVDPVARPDWPEAQARLAKIAGILRTNGHLVQTEVHQGPPASIILQRIERLAPDMVVLGAKGLGSRSTKIGSITRRIVHRAYRSVLIARPGQFVRPLKVLLAVDGSPLARRAVEFLSRLALPQWANITIVSVAEPVKSSLAEARLVEAYLPRDNRPAFLPEMTAIHEAYATDVMRYLQQRGVQGHISISAGDPASEILSVAAYKQADLIVLGAYSQPHSNPFHLGHVARHVVEDALCSVMIVR
ncbi:MAG: universal stress protein [Anaerolineae bacterium]|nr:universal stress protein [Anaerolineae bacterium]